MTRRTFLDRLRPIVALLLGIATIPLVAVPCRAQGEGERVVKTFQERTTLTGGKGERVEKTFQKRKTLTGLPDPFSFERKYVVYLPSNYKPEEPLPLVMVLHGCAERGSSSLPFIEKIEADTKFDELADQERFIVVYPNHKLETDPFKMSIPFCWEWWIDSNIHEGRGEVQDLVGIVKEVQKAYKVDPNRIHITGLSSGACMTVAALVAYSEVFASGSPTAGVPYSETQWNFLFRRYKPVNDVAAVMAAEMGASQRPVPILIIQSEADEMVNFHYAENIRDSWGKAFGIDTQHPMSSESNTTKGTSWTHNKYGSPSSGSVIETLFLHRRPDGGLRHGWYGDGQGQFAFPDAPDTAERIWEFFKAHPLPPCPCPTP